MPDGHDPPPTEEGWYAMHDFRRIDWDAWRDASDRTRQRALDEAVDHTQARLAVEDADDGASALYSVLGEGADLLFVHLRPTSAHIGALERQFELTEFAGFTERTDSFVSVTEASGYSEQAREYFEGDTDGDSGLASYIQTRLKPTIPDATHVCFYPMDKRRDPGQNWYDLPFDERARHMDAHGEIGRDYGGQVVQMITGAIALDDWEWGVTLWGDDLTDMKSLLYEMRFDPSTSKYADFGPFTVGRRFPPEDLPALLSGAPVPTDGESADALETPVHPADAESGNESGDPPTDRADAATGAETAQGTVNADGGETRPDESGNSDPMPETDTGDVETVEDDDMETRLATLGLRGDDYEAGDHALVLYSTASAQELVDEVDGLRGNFEHYDSHGQTVVRAQSGRSAVVSIWETERAAGIAEGFLTELSGVTQSVSGPLGESADGDTGDEDETASEERVAGESETIRERFAEMDLYAGQPHGEDIYALVLYSTADTETLLSEVSELREGFDRYDTHEATDVYDDPGSNTAAVASLWATRDAADTASEYLTDLPEVEGWAEDGDGFGTMGMFYTVKPDRREDFVEKFDTVGEVLTGLDGHRETALLVNTENENDMFIASQWDSKEDAMEFFRSDAFTDTVDWGRDVLADRPRHVFLA
jgi:chlorite dismutase/heme-degrading monooxygenase HmoA